MKTLLLILCLLVTGCVATKPPAEAPRHYLCDEGQFGNFLVIDGEVWLVIIHDGTVLEVCAIPKRRLIIIGSIYQST